MADGATASARRLRPSHSATCRSRSGSPAAAATPRSSAPTLHVADGEFVAIVGPTGCGKSTLLNVAAGLIAPSAGRVDIFGSAARRAQPPGRLSVPGRRAVSLEDRAGERRHRAGDGRHAGARGARARARLADARRPRRVRRPLSAHALGRPAQARRPRAGADPRSENPADGRAVRPARRADPADHGQPAARSVERRPQGGAVRHPRSRGGDRALRPRRHHVGGAGGAHHRRLAGAAAAPARHRRDQARPGLPRTAPRHLADAQGRGDQGLRADGGRRDVARAAHRRCRSLVAVVAIALWYVLTTYPVFGSMLLPPFFFSNPVDVAEQIVDWFVARHDLEASLGHAGRSRCSPS